MQDSIKTVRHEKKNVWFILWEEKKSAEIVSDFPQMLELTDEYFFLFFLINRWIFQISYYKYVKIAKGNYV